MDRAAEGEPGVARLPAARRPPEDHGGGDPRERQPHRDLEHAPPAVCVTGGAQRRSDGVTDRLAGHEHHEPEHHRQAGRHRKQHGTAVLEGEGAVALDAVDAVGAPLDLAHRRGEVDHGEGETEPQCEGAPDIAVGAAPGPCERLREHPVTGTGHDVAEDPFDDPAHRVGVHGRGHADQRQGQRYQAHHDLESQSPCVGEAVGVAKPGEGVDEQPYPAVPPQRGQSLVARELFPDHVPGLRDVHGGSHRGQAPSLGAGATSPACACFDCPRTDASTVVTHVACRQAARRPVVVTLAAGPRGGRRGGCPVGRRGW